ncbi:hypothetical protein COY14_03015 [Candidatus Roizmanbacteria bacterium CG_4_10_14_0_2_um_filter_36_9]|uniref:Branched-chain amino acid aminotransferase n=1 Tax=Candidatus Roizmanbacteria bacterium CG_4_10_14_0_2_um_filter_36_9 TaxID=1974823 RepID=A0A2M7U3P0_9BACT|nr:MAG: hypothetical protein COY14_03015 [Candidatus Roizmanbacteria bacterium CG_4_10_14_0_2_um_filter_36_9]
MIYLNGSWIADDEAKISVLDLSVLRGFGIFDYLRTYGKKPFMLESHIDRFFNSAHLMGMEPVLTKAEIADIVLQGIEKSAFAQTNIKFIQTGGVSPDGFTPSEKQSFFVYFYEFHDFPKEQYTQGTAHRTSRVMRQLPEAKTINYAASITEVVKAQKLGFEDILHTDNVGNIYEGTRCNFYGIKNDTLITANKGILEGITRKVIFEIAKELGIEIDFRFVTTAELPELDEAFTSNSSHEIVPTVRIDSTSIGDGVVGPLTIRFMEEFRKRTLN